MQTPNGTSTLSGTIYSGNDGFYKLNSGQPKIFKEKGVTNITVKKSSDPVFLKLWKMEIPDSLPPRGTRVTAPPGPIR